MAQSVPYALILHDGLHDKRSMSTIHDTFGCTGRSYMRARVIGCLRLHEAPAKHVRPADLPHPATLAGLKGVLEGHLKLIHCLPYNFDHRSITSANAIPGYHIYLLVILFSSARGHGVTNV